MSIYALPRCMSGGCACRHTRAVRHITGTRPSPAYTEFRRHAVAGDVGEAEMTREGFFGIVVALGVLIISLSLFAILPNNWLLDTTLIHVATVGSIIAGLSVHGALARRRMDLTGA